MAERTVEQKNLHRLNAIRLTILLMELLGLGLASWFSVIQVDWSVLSVIAATTGLLVFYTHFRKRPESDISHLRLFKQLLADVILQTLLLYWSGGYTNPFIFSYLVTVTISAALLPVRQRWFITTLTIVCYTLLQKWYQPLIPDHSHGVMHSMIVLHLGGMWFTFSISACLVTGVVAGMAEAIRSHRAEIVASREQRLRDERILAVATTAAGAAHELATPLSTMSVLLGEMSRDCPASSPMGDDVELLQKQVQLCKTRLEKIVLASRNQSVKVRPARDFVVSLLAEWQLLRPEVKVQFDYENSPGYQIETDQALTMAMINLLDNSADASPDFVRISISRQEQNVVLQIEDHGEGVLNDIARQPGITAFSTKKDGLGLGLQLSVATVERLHGDVRLYQGETAGTITDIRLPEISEHD